MFAQPYRERRAVLEELELGPWAQAVDVYEDGDDAVRGRRGDGIVAKRLNSSYRPGERGWVKTKNRAYWRYPLELEAVRRSIERTTAAVAH
jgi:ATP-dependent DNA ligase